MSEAPDENVYVEAEIVDDEFKAPVLQDIKYPVTQDALHALVEEYKDIPNIDLNADDDIVAEQYKFVRDGQIRLAKERNRIEKTRKTIKSPAFEFGKNVDAFAKKLQAIIKDPEDKLKFQRDRVEQNEARKQREAEEAEELRVETIQKKIANMERMPLEMMPKSSLEIREILGLFDPPTETEYEEFYDKALILHSQVQTQLTQMAENKELVENAQALQAEKDAEAKRLKDEEDAKLQAEKDKLAQEKAEFQRQKDDFEAEKRAAQEETDRKEAERLADELQAKQEEEAKQQAKINAQKHDEMVKETMKVLNTYSEMIILLDDIIDGKIPHVKWMVSDE